MVWMMAMLVWIAGTCVFAASAFMVVKANPTGRVPQWFGRPQHHSGGIYAVRAAAVALLLGATFLLSAEAGLWATVAIIFGAIPAVLIVHRHNRALENAGMG